MGGHFISPGPLGASACSVPILSCPDRSSLENQQPEKHGNNQPIRQSLDWAEESELLQTGSQAPALLL